LFFWGKVAKFYGGGGFFTAPPYPLSRLTKANSKKGLPQQPILCLLIISLHQQLLI